MRRLADHRMNEQEGTARSVRIAFRRTVPKSLLAWDSHGWIRTNCCCNQGGATLNHMVRKFLFLPSLGDMLA